MRQLIWKELREQRYIPIAYGALVIVIAVAWYMVADWLYAHNEVTSGLTAHAAGQLYFFACSATGLFPAGGAFAAEIGNGTLAFLRNLPVGNRRILTAKLAAGSITMLLSLVSVTIAYVFMVLTLFGPQEVRAEITGVANSTVSLLMLASAVVFAAYGFSACLVVSMLVDRSVVATTLGLIAAIVFYVVGGVWMMSLRIETSHPYDGIILSMIILGTLTATFLGASYATFCIGDFGFVSRFKRAGLTVLVGLLTSFAIIFACVSAENRAYAEIQAHREAMEARLGVRMKMLRWDRNKTAGKFGVLHFRVTFPDPKHDPTFKSRIYLMPRRGLDPRSDMRGEYDWASTAVDSSPCIKAKLMPWGQVSLTLQAHPTPGTYHDTVTVKHADGSTVAVIDVENVTQ